MVQLGYGFCGQHQRWSMPRRSPACAVAFLWKQGTSLTGQSGSPPVLMMKTTDVRNDHNDSLVRILHQSRHGTLFVER